jgi:hypothetical protein
MAGLRAPMRRNGFSRNGQQTDQMLTSTLLCCYVVKTKVEAVTADEGKRVTPRL